MSPFQPNASTHCRKSQVIVRRTHTRWRTQLDGRQCMSECMCVHVCRMSDRRAYVTVLVRIAIVHSVCALLTRYCTSVYACVSACACVNIFNLLLGRPLWPPQTEYSRVSCGPRSPVQNRDACDYLRFFAAVSVVSVGGHAHTPPPPERVARLQLRARLGGTT